MNVGQILETHLGAASVGLGKKFVEKALESEKSKAIDELKNMFEKLRNKSMTMGSQS